jgi:salicylate hydroxylase
LQPRPHVIVAGAGIGGLTAALALLLRGFDVDIYEQAHELRDVGAGIQIAANGTRVLIALELEGLLKPFICEAAAKEVRIWNTGRMRTLFNLGEDSIKRFGAPYWMIHRGDLHRVLLNAVLELKADAVHVNARCTGFRQGADAVELLLENGDAIAGDVLIGADGVHSQIRSQMFNSPKAEFTGLMAWRGLAPMDELCDELRRPVGTNWIGPGGHVITYPLRSNTLLNFVGFVENVEWTSESWTESGTNEECAADFANWHPLVKEVIEHVDVPFRWALVSREPLEQWTEGRVTLLGDACHPTLPFLAQGAIMAIEDGLILARCLAQDIANPERALLTYENLRKERTTAIVRGSFANLARFHNAALADPVKAIEHLDREWEPEQIRCRYDWLFDYDATQVAVA